MRVRVIEEHGYEAALFGMGLSFGKTSPFDYYEEWPFHHMSDVAEKLSGRDGGHNKFLESIVVWLDITAPRYWWQEFDTYRVGTTKQSESTMHTMTTRHLYQKDFEGENIPLEIITYLNDLIDQKEWKKVKEALPESFRQRRIVCTNYKVLRNMIQQRKKHKLTEWRTFIKNVLGQIKRPQFLPSLHDRSSWRAAEEDDGYMD